jgi:hypothetical protein
VELQVRLHAAYPATAVVVEVVAPPLRPRVLAAVEAGFATEAAALAATQRSDALRCLLRFVDNHIGRLAAEAVPVSVSLRPLREWTWWTHTGGGNAPAFKQPT